MTNETSMFIPFRNHSDVIIQTRREKRFVRTVKASLIAFLITVTLVSFVSNKFDAYERKLRAAAATCQANTQQPTQSAHKERGRHI